MMFKNTITNNSDFGKLLLRFSTGGLMLFHGISKLRTNIDEVAGWIVSYGLPHFLAYGVFVGEILAPLFILCGFFVRTAAFVFAVNMLVACFYLYTKGFVIFGLNEFGGLNSELDLLYLFSSLALVFLGGGKYAISFNFKEHRMIQNKNGNLANSSTLK